MVDIVVVAAFVAVVVASVVVADIVVVAAFVVAVVESVVVVDIAVVAASVVVAVTLVVVVADIAVVPAVYTVEDIAAAEIAVVLDLVPDPYCSFVEPVELAYAFAYVEGASACVVDKILEQVVA